MKCDEYNNACVIAAGGDLAGPEAAHVGAAVDERLGDRRFVNFVIDLAAARFVDSRGLEALLEARRRCEERGGQLKLAGLTDNVRAILRLTRLDHRFEQHAEVAAALKAMG